MPLVPLGCDNMWCMPDDINGIAMTQCATGQHDNDVSAALGVLYIIECNFNAKVAKMQAEFQYEIQDFWRQHLQPLCVSPALVTVCETTVVEEKVLSCSGCAKTGMTWLAECAHQVMKEEGMDSTLLQTWSEPKQIATLLAANPSSAKVAHLLRDLLVLTVCTDDGPWTNASIQETMNNLFDKEVDNHFMAKILLAYNTMHRAATSLQEFNRTVKFFSESFTLSEKTRENLLAAYIELYRKAPDFKSNARFQGKNRPAKRPKPKGNTSPDPTDMGKNVQLNLDLADLQASAAKDPGCVKPDAQKVVK